MAGIDPLAGMALTEAHKAAVRKQLRQLAAQDGRPVVRDMARDVLVGKLDLRGAILGPRHTELLDEGMRQFSGWYRNLSPEERAEHERQGVEFAAAAREEEVAEQRPARRPRPSAEEEEEWETPRPILRKRRPRR